MEVYSFNIHSKLYWGTWLYHFSQEPHFTFHFYSPKLQILKSTDFVYVSINLSIFEFKGLYCIYFATLFLSEPNKIGHPMQETTSNVTGKEWLRRCADVSEVRTVAERVQMPFWGCLLEIRGGMVKLVIFFILSWQSQWLYYYCHLGRLNESLS